MFSAGSVVDDKLDMVSGEVNYITRFPEETPIQGNMHIRCFHAENRLYFLPGAGGNKVHIFDISDGSMKSVQIAKERSWEGHAIEHNGYVWIIPHKWDVKNSILKIDSKTQVHVNSIYADDTYYIKRIVKHDDKMVFSAGNRIVSVNLNDGSKESFYTDIIGTLKVFYVDDRLLVIHTDSNDIYRWSEDGSLKKETTYCLPSELNEVGNVVNTKDEVCFLPVIGSTIYIYDKESRRGHLVHLNCEFGFSTYDLYKNSILCFPFRNKYMLKIDIKEKTAHEIDIKLGGQELLDAQDDFIAANGIVKENVCFTLESFLTGLIG